MTPQSKRQCISFPTKFIEAIQKTKSLNLLRTSLEDGGTKYYDGVGRLLPYKGKAIPRLGALFRGRGNGSICLV